jgi:hypothetical protein
LRKRKYHQRPNEHIHACRRIEFRVNKSARDRWNSVKSPGVLATKKRQLRIAFVFLGAVVIVFVIVPRILAYNCSPLFNAKKLDSDSIAKFQPQRGR